MAIAVGGVDNADFFLPHGRREALIVRLFCVHMLIATYGGHHLNVRKSREEMLKALPVNFIIGSGRRYSVDDQNVITNNSSSVEQEFSRSRLMVSSAGETSLGPGHVLKRVRRHSFLILSAQ